MVAIVIIHCTTDADYVRLGLCKMLRRRHANHGDAVPEENARIAPVCERPTCPRASQHTELQLQDAPSTSVAGAVTSWMSDARLTVLSAGRWPRRRPVSQNEAPALCEVRSSTPHIQIEHGFIADREEAGVHCCASITLPASSVLTSEYSM